MFIAPDAPLQVDIVREDRRSFMKMAQDSSGAFDVRVIRRTHFICLRSLVPLHQVLMGGSNEYEYEDEDSNSNIV